ncbi:MAG: hypothetical protein WA771_08540 [Chthoniobacterales bacterium]
MFAAHNFHAVVMAFLSLFAAVLLWVLAGFFFVLILLGLTTAVRGDEGPAMPEWIVTTAAGGVGLLLIWGWWDRWLHRYVELRDRPIVGWHLFADVALLPVRLTFAVTGNFGAILWVGPERVARAWQLLLAIKEAKRAPVSSLTLVERDGHELHYLLRALQLTGCIDLHAGKEGWFYTVRGNLAEDLQRWLAGDGVS